MAVTNITLNAGSGEVLVTVYLNNVFIDPQYIAWTTDAVLQPISIIPAGAGFRFSAPVGMPKTEATANAYATNSNGGGEGVLGVNVIEAVLTFNKSIPGQTLLYNIGGWLVVDNAAGWPSSASGLLAGDLWSNGTLVTVIPGATPNPSAPPVFFGNITAADLLALGGGNLPLTNPGSGSGQLYNQGGVVSVA